MKILLIIFAIFLTSCLQPNVNAEEECVFDPSSVTKPVLEEKEIIHLNWDDSLKEARVILKSGEFLSIKYWSCNHFGMDAELIIPFYESENIDIKEKASWLGKKLLSDSDDKLFQSAIKQHKNIDYNIDIPITNSNYSEFYLKVKQLDNLLIISIYYYYS